MVLDPLVIGLVLLAALMHASWNAIVKADGSRAGGDRLSTFGVIMLAGAALGVAAAPFVPLPAPASWRWIWQSVLIHNFYYFFLMRAYAHGDLSHVYPIARGLGPTLVALFSGVLVGEELRFHEAVGVMLVSFGVIGLAVGNGVRGLEWRPTLYAAITGVTIAGYTVTDGIGARVSGDALSYIVWLNICEGPWVFLAAIVVRRGALWPYLRKYWRRGAAGGMIATAGYGIAIWALSVGAMAHVAALRETSVLFAALIGTRLLGESFGRRRIAAASLIVAGLALMNAPLG
jgi:drug/metabolite transporter (DMT)-like permease